MAHTRRTCPITGCRSHKWPPGTSRADLRASGVRETQRFRGATPAALAEGARQAHQNNDLAHVATRLVDDVERVLAAAGTRRSKYDGRQVIEEGKRRRRELISRYVAGGWNGL